VIGAMSDRRYVGLSWADRIFNGVARLLTGAGVSLYGSRNLAVRGRKSGEWRIVPVNLLDVGGVSFLVAPRGETQWVRNVRAAGGGELRLGRHSQPFRAVELSDADKPPVLRAYLARWRFEVARFFEGVGTSPSDEELRCVAGRYPVFRIETTPVSGSPRP
jgi:deazaflavin-dependent oxidoreductase (nitroreductase family)